MTKNTVLTVATLLLISGSISIGSVILYTPVAGDAQFYWNSKYGWDAYTTGTTTMGVGLGMNPGYGNDYTVSIFEIPIASLTSGTLTGATLVVESLGFGTGYWYGSAAIGWLDTGTAVLTGDVVADNLGPASKARPGGFTIYNSDYGDIPGTKSFDVLSCILTDIAAGRTYSTFVMSGSRDTGGSIYTAESGSGPRIVAIIPEPATIAMLGMGFFALIKQKSGKN